MLRGCSLATHVEGPHGGEVEGVVEVDVDGEVGVGGVLDGHAHVRHVSKSCPVRILHQRLHGRHAVLRRAGRK